MQIARDPDPQGKARPFAPAPDVPMSETRAHKRGRGRSFFPHLNTGKPLVYGEPSLGRA